MTKADLVENIVEKYGIPKNMAEGIVNDMIGEMKKTLIDGKPIYLRGFGTFKVVTRKSKKARDISRDKEIIVPAHDKPVWNPSQKLTDAVNGKIEPAYYNENYRG